MKTKKIIWRGAVGKKVLALMDWLRGQGRVAVGFSGGVGVSLPSGHPGTSNTATPGTPATDAVSAMENLGFKPHIAAQAVSVALEELGEEAEVSALIRLALKRVG